MEEMHSSLGKLLSDTLELIIDEIGSKSDIHNLYDLVKDNVNEALTMHIDKYFSDIKDIFIRTTQTRSRCGHIFKRGDLIYHCSDCTDDETCVLCQNCFNKDFHKDHGYAYYFSKSSGGCCDCGEDESWKNPLGCSLHSESPLPDSPTFNESLIKSLYGELFEFIVSVINDYTKTVHELDQGISCVVLYNDERHSFDDVIYLLKRVLSSTEDEASKMAEAVDLIGFSCIFLSTKASDCFEKIDNMSFSELESTVIGLKLLVKMIIIDVLQEWIKNSLDNMRPQQLEYIFNLACDSESRIIESFLIHDSFLWKNIRKNFQSILVKLSLITPNFKYKTAKLFLEHFPTILDHYVEETRENHLTILNFIVQLFSTPTVICKLVSEDELVPKILNLACESAPKTSLSGFQRAFSVCLQAICYALTDSTVKDHNLFMNIDYFSILIEMFKKSFAADRFMIERIGDEHVLYEDQKWISVFNFSLSVARFTYSFISAITFDPLSAKGFLNKLVTEIESCSQEMLKTDYYRLASSWYQPFVWAFAFIQAREFSPDPSIFKTFLLELSFQTELLYYQISSGYWIRNGQSVQSQASLYASPDFRFYFRLPSCFVIQSFLRVIDTRQFDEILAKSLHFTEIYNHPERLQQLKLFKMVSWLLVSLITNQFSLDDSNETLEKIVLSLLYIQPYTFSQFSEIMPSPYNIKTKAIEAALSKYAILSSKDVNICYDVNPSYASNFNPYFYGYTESQRTQAISHVESLTTLKWEDVLKINLDASINSSTYKLIVENFTSEFLSLAVSFCSEFSDTYLLQNYLILYFVAFSTGNDLSLDHQQLSSFYLKPEYSTLRSLIYSICSFQKEFQLPVSLEPVNNTRKANRKKFEDKFRSMQMNFLKHSSYENNTNEEFEKCIVCQEALHLSLDAYGKLVCIQKSSLLKTITPDFPHDDGFFIDGCNHCIHYECFRKLPTSFYQNFLPKKSCPMCRKVCSHILCLPTEYNTKYTLNELLTLSGFSSLDMLIETIIYTFSCFKLLDFVDLKTNNIFTDLIRFCILLIKEKFNCNQNINYDDTSSKAALLKNILIAAVCNDVNPKKFHILFDKIETDALLSIFERALSHEHFEIVKSILNHSKIDPNNWDTDHCSPEILIPLPNHYDEFITKYNNATCKNCAQLPTDPSVCLFCGELVCTGNRCCFMETGECNQHFKKCCPTLGLFLLLNKPSIFVFLDNVGFTIDAPYLTKHFEFDLDLRHGLPLFLNQHLYEQLKQKVVRHQLVNEYWNYIDNNILGRMPLNDWSAY